MRHFSSTYKLWNLQDRPEIKIISVESRGQDVSDMMVNAIICGQTADGKVIEIVAEELSHVDHDALVLEFTLYLNEGSDE